MNRRLLALALAGTLCLPLLSACGGQPSGGPSPSPSPSALESTAPDPSASPAATPIPDKEPLAPGEAGTQEPTVPSQPPDAASSARPTSSAAPSQISAPTPSQAPAATPTPAPTPDPVEPEPQVDVVQSTWNAIAQYELPALMELDGDTLSAIYGINADDLESYVCQMPLMNVQATEFFLAQVKDGRMDTVKAAVEQRQKDLEDQWSQYLPEQLELVQNYQLVTSGNYILFAVSEYADAAVAAFRTYTT